MATTRPAQSTSSASRPMPSLIVRGGRAMGGPSRTNYSQPRKKKMNVFKRIMKAWLFDDQNEVSDGYNETAPKSIEATSPESGNYIYFKLHHASGGFVVEHRSYNHENETYVPPKLTIITNEEDLGKRLKDIVFMEGLGR